jgi:hypothetical protein
MVVSLALTLLPVSSVFAAEGVALTGYVDGVFQAMQGANPDPAKTGTSWNTSFGDASQAVIWANGQPSENVAFTAELYYRQTSNLAVLRQAVIDWRLMGDKCTAYFGKFYFPFGIEYRSVYSTTNALVSRPTVQGWSDNGFGLMGKMDMQGGMGLRWNVAATNGLSGPALAYQSTDANNNNKSIGGRLEILPMEDKLNVGGSFAWGKYDASAKNNYTLAGAHADYMGMENLDVRGEFMWQKLAKAAAGGKDLTGMGVYGQASYRMKIEGYNYFEPVVRFSWMDPNRDAAAKTDAVNQLAIGAGFSPVEHFVLKGEFDLNNEDSSVKTDNNAVMLQAVYGW